MFTVMQVVITHTKIFVTVGRTDKTYLNNSRTFVLIKEQRLLCAPKAIFLIKKMVNFKIREIHTEKKEEVLLENFWKAISAHLAHLQIRFNSELP